MNIKPKTIKLLKEDTEKYPGDFEIIKKKIFLEAVITKKTWVTYTFSKLKFSALSKGLDKGKEFPGGPVVRSLWFHCRGHRFDPWSGNLRSHMPSGVAKKKKSFF